MQNPIMAALGQRRLNSAANPQFQNAFNSARQIMSMIQNSGNPIGMLQSMATQNPMVQQTMQYVNACGGNARQAFYNLAQQKGIDPNSVLNMIPR